MIHDEINGDERLDNLRIFTEMSGGRTHRGQIDQQGHTREILQHYPSDDERNLLNASALWLPVRERTNAGFRDLFAIAITEHGFKHDTNGDRKTGDRSDTRLFQRRQGVELPF